MFDISVLTLPTLLFGRIEYDKISKIYIDHSTSIPSKQTILITVSCGHGG